VTCAATDTMVVRDAIEAAGFPVESADLTMVPSSLIELDSAEAARSVLKVIDALEEHDDVNEVFANFDISDEILAELG